MTDVEDVSKTLADRDLQQRGAVGLWGRRWKADLVLHLKDEHETLSETMLAYSRAIPQPGTKVMTEEDERLVRMSKSVAEMLRATRELMLRLALHPTCPKATQEGRGGGRGRSSGPELEAHVVSPPDPGQPTVNP